MRVSSVRPVRDALGAALLFFFTAALCVLMIAVVAERSQLELVRGDLLRYANAAAGLIDGDRHARITRPEQTDSPEYRALIDPLVAMHRRVPEIAYLYTFVERGGRLYFVLDTATQASRLGFPREMEASRVMDLFESQSPEEDEREVRAVREGRAHVSARVTEDEFGTFITGLAPIFDSAGKPVAAVGVDLDASQLARRLEQTRLTAAAALGVAGLAASLVGVLVWRIRRRSLLDERARHGAMAAWREAEARNALLVQALGEVAYHHDLRLDHITYTGDTEELLGLEPEGLGRNLAEWLERVHAEDRERVNRAFEDALRDRRIFSVEYRVRHADGSTVWVSDRGVFTYATDGSAAAIDGVMIDVTQRRQSDERFRVIFEATTEPHFLVDRDAVLDCNQAALDLLGYTDKSQILGQPLATFWPELQGDGRTSTAPRHLTEEGRLEREQLVKRRPDGELIPVEVGRTFVTIGGRRVMLVVWHDLSEIKRAEQSLSESEARFRDLVENLEHVIFQTDLDGRLTFVNPAWERVTGFSAVEALGRPYASYILPEDLPPLFAVRERQMAGLTDVEPIEFRAPARNGRLLCMRGHCRLQRDPSGQVIGVTGVLADVTALRENERELIGARDAAERANRAKSEFLAVMSHEIRTPLNGVIGFSHLLLQTQLDATQQEYLRTIASCGDALLTIIDDVLDFSRMESGHLELEHRTFSLAECVEEVLDVHATRAFAKRLELVADIDPGVPPAVVGDPGRLRQVLTNLVGNAVKFTPRGEVLVRARVRSEDAERGTARVEFLVRDTGIGIPAEKLPNLFDPFVQADSTMARRFGGAGLGLAICRRLVQAMGGEIGVSSAPGEGAMFTFSVELGCPPTGERPSPEHFFAGRRALLVQRNDAAREALARQLGALGLEVVAAAACPRKIPGDADVLLVDGELAESARAEPALASIPMIVLVPRAAPADGSNPTEALLRLGRPVRQRDLVARLRGTFERGGSPLAADDAGGEANTEGLPDPGHTRILVVEDNLVNQKLIRRMLVNFGYEPQLVGGGDACLSVCGAEPVDLILMDIQMPGMDGFMTTERLRARGDRAWIVALTAHVMNEDRERCAKAGMNDFLAKPIRPDALREVLVRYARSHRAG